MEHSRHTGFWADDPHALTLDLPDHRRAILWSKAGILTLTQSEQTPASPVRFTTCLSLPASQRLACFFHAFPAVVPYQTFVTAPHTRVARMRLYERMVALRHQLEGSGLEIIPATSEGYLLAVSSVVPPPDARLQSYCFAEGFGMTFAPHAGLLLLFREGVPRYVQRYPHHQLHLLTAIVAEYPYYCPYERLLSARLQVTYDPVVFSSMLEQLPRHKSLHPIHQALSRTRSGLSCLGLHLQAHRDLGYQLQITAHAQEELPARQQSA
jgi:hypothetical protein